MEFTLEQAIREKFLISFNGRHAPQQLLTSLQRSTLGGVTLFREHNLENPSQVKELTRTLQEAASSRGNGPLLIGLDQEGGQLMSVEGATPFPGNMALGATRSPELAFRAGRAIGCELAAMGININYAPVCDVNSNPSNPVVGTRSFGEDPGLVAALAAAMVQGIQTSGVAATAKHFPGHGDTETDSHYGAPVLQADLARLEQVEMPPFAAAIRAGVKLVMTAHIALPALHAGTLIPSTLSATILRGLLREKLGFEGVIVTDALDMQAIQQGMGLVIDVIAAAAAGADLLLLKHDPEKDELVYKSLLQAARRMILSESDIFASAGRIRALKQWVRQVDPPTLEVVGCAEHRKLAFEIASQSITKVRDRNRLLPLQLSPQARVAVLMPAPADLTPADTSSYVKPGLAQALRRYQPAVDETIFPLQPAQNDTAALLDKVRGYDLVILGTINAFSYPGQLELARAILATGIPTVVVALRLPYDIHALPEAPACICTYSLLPPSMEALAQAMWGAIPFSGQLPVSISRLQDQTIGIGKDD